MNDDLIVEEYENIDAENTGSVTLDMLSKYAKDVAGKCTAERCEKVIIYISTKYWPSLLA